MECKYYPLLFTLSPGLRAGRAALAFIPMGIHCALGRGSPEISPPPLTVLFGFYFVDNKK